MIYRYNMTQIASVVLVTLGVAITTLSASGVKVRSTSTSNTPVPTSQYATGIAILSLALLFSGALGLAQDWSYGRSARVPSGSSTPASNGTANGHSNVHANGSAAKTTAPSTTQIPSFTNNIQPWQESMFYLHFLSLPMFIFVRHDLVTQFRALHSSTPLRLRLPSSLTPVLHPPIGLEKPFSLAENFELEIPSGYVPLAFTTLTSLVCVAGVNRLTARVSSLTVTLVLVIRKAVSMVISVVLFERAGARAGQPSQINASMMWAGAALVFMGTMAYAAGSRIGKPQPQVVKVKRD